MRRRVTPLARALGVLVAVLAAVLMSAAPSFAAPVLTIDAEGTMKDGQTVTVSGAGFAANLKGIAIGQCRKGYEGPGDCNLQGGAVFRDSDASGKVPSFTIVIKEKFGAVDCLAEECVIAAGPLPTAADAATVAANTYEIPMSFKAETAEAPAAAPAEAPAAAPAEAPAAGGDTALPRTGAGDSVPVLLLGATALLCAGVGVMLLVPGRRREATR